MAQLLGVPVADGLTEHTSDGKDRPLSREKFFISGSLMRMSVDNTNPLAFGMPSQVDVFFDNSPVFKLGERTAAPTSRVAWFSGTTTLQSGWAWGQQYLDGLVGVAEAKVGEGRVMMMGPEVTFRGEPHATFKLLFNGLFYGSAQPVILPGR